MTEPKQTAHLVVISHGLWGGPSNVYHVERILQEVLKDIPDENFYFLRPKSVGYLKTYDGIEACGDSIIKEIFDEIENLKTDKNVEVESISMLGYSLGGLFTRYCIGKFYEAGVFDKIRPRLFATFATPHVGVKFWDNKLLDKLLNFMGTNLLAKSGKDLFIEQSDILIRLADPNDVYFKGLALFDTRITMANCKNDRTVAFYTAFMTRYSPFVNFDDLDLKFLSDEMLPQIDLKESGHRLPLSIVDFNESKLAEPSTDDQSSKYSICSKRSGSSRPIVSADQSSAEAAVEYASILAAKDETKRKQFLALVTVLSPIFIPVVLLSSVYAISRSYIRALSASPLNVQKNWQFLVNNLYLTGTVSAASQSHAGSKDKSKAAHHQSEAIDEMPNSSDEEHNENYIARATAEMVENVLELSDENKTKISQGQTITAEDDQLKEDDSRHKADEDYKTVNVSLDSMNKNYEKLIEKLKSNSIDSSPIVEKIKELPFDKERIKICENLNQLEWIKIPILIDSVNSHATIVMRAQMTDTFKCGVSGVYLFASIAKNELLRYKTGSTTTA